MGQCPVHDLLYLVLVWREVGKSPSELSPRSQSARGIGVPAPPIDLHGTRMIRPASLNDHQRIEEIWWASVQATHHFIAPAYLGEIRKHLLSDCLSAVDLFVWGDGPSAVGFLALSRPVAETGCCIEMLFVHPSAMRKGIGRALLEFAFTQGANRVGVNEANEAALQFYRAHGFTVANRDELDGAGQPYPTLSLVRYI